jgi:hypothetical protein
MDAIWTSIYLADLRLSFHRNDAITVHALNIGKGHSQPQFISARTSAEQNAG